jgi:CO/xanthine dehydrogenase Mo-binding subunit
MPAAATTRCAAAVARSRRSGSADATPVGLAETLKAVAGHRLDVDPGDIELREGRAVDTTDPGTAMEIEELANVAMLGNPETLGPEKERPEALRGGISLVGRGKYQSQEVEFVDPDTGRGNVAQGLGETLHEAYAYDEDGNLLNGSMADYHLPTAKEVPMITNIEELESPDPTTSHGQKGVGECPLVPTSAAVANAVRDATGIRFHDLPISADRVLPRLAEAGLREL